MWPEVGNRLRPFYFSEVAMIKLVEDIPTGMHHRLLQFVSSLREMWGYRHGTVSRDDPNLKIKQYAGIQFDDNPQMVFSFMKPEGGFREEYAVIHDMITHVVSNHLRRRVEVVRIKCNLQMQRREGAVNSIHRDSPEPDCVTFLFYINESDGDTFFFKDDEVILRLSPKPGLGVIFPSNLLHAGSAPKAHPNRIVLNCVFRILD